MESEPTIILLFLIASAVSVGAARLHIPYTVALVLTGLALGVLQLFHAPQLTRDIVFMIFLPGLVFEAAFHIEFEELWRDRITVLGLAIPGVVASIGITAALLVFASNEIPYLQDMSWALALVFGAAVAATYPIAVVSLFKELGAPRRLTLLIEGESLLNDGTSIVFFMLILGVTLGESISPDGIVVEFGRVVGGGIIIGGMTGLLVSQMLRRIDDAMVEITLTTVAAYGSFLLADQLGYSGVISTVAAGLICGNYGAQTGMSPSTRVATETFWEYIGFALNSLIFLLVGLQVHMNTLLSAWPMIVIAYLVITLTRGIVIFTTSVLLAPTRARLPKWWSIVLIWGGLRGALSMVLALSLPVDMLLRELIMAMVFGVVLLSLLIQGLSMAPLTRHLGIVGGREELKAWETAQLRKEMVNDVLDTLAHLRKRHHASPEALDVIEAHYREQQNTATAALDSIQLDKGYKLNGELAQLHRRMVLLEKQRLLEARRHGAIGPDSFNQLLADIDARYLELESAGLPQSDLD